jgi:hypothetical protein
MNTPRYAELKPRCARRKSKCVVPSQEHKFCCLVATGRQPPSGGFLLSTGPHEILLTERIGPKQSRMPEGFLLCEEVPIARCGIRDLPRARITAEVLNGVIRVQRLAPAAMATFAGKPSKASFGSTALPPVRRRRPGRALRAPPLQNISEALPAPSATFTTSDSLTDATGSALFAECY